MILTVNGKEAGLRDGLTVGELLVEEKVKWPDMVSVELNGNILKRSDFAAAALAEGDKVEFLYFMGGGR